AAFQEDINVFFLTCGQGISAIPSLVQHKDPHGHPKLGQQAPYPFLFLCGASGKAIVFYTAEPLIISKLDLVKYVLPRVILELTLMGTVVKVKWLFRLLIYFRAADCPCRTAADNRPG